MNQHQFDYDAIIVGGSFAALSTASRIKGKTLMIANREVGSFQTSACGAPEDLVRGIGCGDSILARYDSATVHLKRRSREYALPRPFCVFDYGMFCESLWSRSNADFVQAEVLGVQNNTVLTSRGSFTAKCIVDCSGWKAVLARSIDPTIAARTKYIRAIETVGQPSPQMGGMHFWFEPEYHGYSWLFSRENGAGIGIGIWSDRSDLARLLLKQCQRVGADLGSAHGGHLPTTLSKGTIGSVFLVGDAAGQCLPLTGEGIRPALYFGQICGKIIQHVVDGTTTSQEGLREYADLVERVRSSYQILGWLQQNVMTSAGFWLHILLGLMDIGPLRRYMFRRYSRPLRTARNSPL